VTTGRGLPEYEPRPVEWTPEITRRFWELEVTREQNSFARRYGARIVPVICRFVPARSHVLDVGGGPGILAAQLLDAGYTVTVAEATRAGRERTTDRNQERDGYRGVVTVERIGRSGPFDAAVGVEVLEHLQDDEIINLLGLLRRSLPPGSRCVFTTPNQEELGSKVVGCPDCGAQFHRWQHVRSPDPTWLENVLGTPGFVPLRVFTTDWGRPRPSWLRDRRIRRSHGPHLVGVAERV
jgi:SAM-dependent methyltransferase